MATDQPPELEAVLAGLRDPENEPVRPKTNILPSGREILERLKADGQEIPEDEAREILKISDDEAAAKLLMANVGETINPDEMEANSVFSGWLMDKINIPPMLLTLQFDNLGQYSRAIEFCYKELAKTGKEALTPEQRNSVLKTMVNAIKAKGNLVKNVLQMAQLKPPDGKKKPRNAPPDTLNKQPSKPPQVVVQINNRVEAGRDETKETRVLDIK